MKKKTVYGLKYAAITWYKSVVNLVQDLGALKSRLDPIVFYWRNERGLSVVMCSHVNGFIYRGNKEFEEEVVGRLKERLKEGSEEVGDFKYIGVEIRQEKDKIVIGKEKSRYVNS